MAGLLDLFAQRDPNDPVNMGLLGMSAALGTPVRQGGGVGPAFGAFGQGFQSSQQADMRRRLMEAQMEEMRAEAEQRRMPKARNPVSVTGGYIDANGQFVRTQVDKEDKDPPEVALAKIAFPNDPAKQREAIAAILKRKSEHAPVQPGIGTVIQEPTRQIVLDKNGRPINQFDQRPNPAADAAAARLMNLPPSLQTKLIEIQEANDSSEMAVNALNEAEQLNDKTYSGYFSVARATARSNLPGKPDPAADATINYDNIIRTQAASSLKVLFGGQPTEGERKVLFDLQASVDKTPAQRKEILERAKRLAADRIARNKKLADGIKAGNYSTKDGGTPAPVEDPLGIR